MTDKEPLFFNRELSWLEFNQRVLGEALDAEVPLLERVKDVPLLESNEEDPLLESVSEDLEEA